MKHLFFILILCLGVLSVTSQNIKIGAIAGINASQVGGDGLSGFNKAGLVLGGFADLDVSEKINVQFEIIYSQKGSRKNPKTDEGDTEFFLLQMDYIEVPIMVRYRNKKFTYDGGFYVGQLVNDHLEDENGPFSIPPRFNQLKDQDFGVLIGLNFNFTENIIMNWRFSNSLVNVREFQSGENFRFRGGLVHTYFSFTMRYEFGASE